MKILFFLFFFFPSSLSHLSDANEGRGRAGTSLEGSSSLPPTHHASAGHPPTPVPWSTACWEMQLPQTKQSREVPGLEAGSLSAVAPDTHQASAPSTTHLSAFLLLSLFWDCTPPPPPLMLIPGSACYPMLLTRQLSIGGSHDPLLGSY